VTVLLNNYEHFYIYTIYIVCVCTYDTTRQLSNQAHIYLFIIVLCCIADKLYIQSREVNMMNLWNKTCLLCYITEVCYNFDIDIRCIINLVEPLDIRLLGLLRKYQQYRVFCTSTIIKIMHCCISTTQMVTQMHHSVSSKQLS
jgi:hypothetical protein